MTPICKCSPLAPLLTIQSVPLCQNDLITGNDEEMVDDLVIDSFDRAWNNLLRERGCLKCACQNKIAALQQEAVRLKIAKDNLKVELTKQSAFVRSTRDEMEASYQRQWNEVQASIGKAEEKAKAKLTAMDTMIKSAGLTLPWKNFIKELDRRAALSTILKDRQLPVDQNGFDPSKYNARAVFLSDCYGNMGKDDNPNLILRADCVENALLKSHIQILKMEIDRQEMDTSLKEEVGEQLLKLHC